MPHLTLWSFLRSPEYKRRRDRCRQSNVKASIKILHFQPESGIFSVDPMLVIIDWTLWWAQARNCQGNSSLKRDITGRHFMQHREGNTSLAVPPRIYGKILDQRLISPCWVFINLTPALIIIFPSKQCYCQIDSHEPEQIFGVRRSPYRNIKYVVPS